MNHMTTPKQPGRAPSTAAAATIDFIMGLSKEVPYKLASLRAARPEGFEAAIAALVAAGAVRVEGHVLYVMRNVADLAQQVAQAELAKWLGAGLVPSSEGAITAEDLSVIKSAVNRALAAALGPRVRAVWEPSSTATGITGVLHIELPGGLT